MSAEKEYREAGGGDDDEELEEEAYRSSRDAVLFAVEVSDSMLKPQGEEGGDSSVQAALKCASRLIQQRIISNPKDMMGILLFGTQGSKFYDEEAGVSSSEQQSKGSLSYPHCYLLMDLDVPSAQDVRFIRDLVQKWEEDDEESGAEEGPDIAKVLTPAEEQVSMANVLFCANQIFTMKAPTYPSRRVFIVTDNDSPHSGNKALKSAAAVRARDLFDLGVMVELFPIIQEGVEFDKSKFYDDIIYRSPITEIDSSGLVEPSKISAGDGISLLNSLLCSVTSKSVPKRAQFSNVPLEIGPGFTIAVNGYAVLKRQTPSPACHVWEGGEVAQIVEKTSTQTASDTARVVQKWEVKRAYTFGGEQICFSDEEMKALRSFGSPIIKILGFKPLTDIPFWASMKHPTFIYPSDNEIVGSTRVFAALYKTLSKQQKAALVLFLPRRNSSPVMAAMIAGEEKKLGSGQQSIPAGMWVIPLPFVDDTRPFPETPDVHASDDLIDKMQVIVEQLLLPKGKYDPSKYPNPSLQHHYRILQALALDEDVPETPDDKTVPKYRQIHKRTGGYVQDWNGELKKRYLELGLDQPERAVQAKRPAPIDTNAQKGESTLGSTRKKVKVEDDDSGQITSKAEQFYAKGQLNKLNMDDLKRYLKAMNLSAGGKKADLLERAEGALEKK